MSVTACEHHSPSPQSPSARASRRQQLALDRVARALGQQRRVLFGLFASEAIRSSEKQTNSQQLRRNLDRRLLAVRAPDVAERLGGRRDARPDDGLHVRLQFRPGARRRRANGRIRRVVAQRLKSTISTETFQSLHSCAHLPAGDGVARSPAVDAAVAAVAVADAFAAAAAVRSDSSSAARRP